MSSDFSLCLLMSIMCVGTLQIVKHARSSMYGGVYECHDQELPPRSMYLKHGVIPKSMAAAKALCMVNPLMVQVTSLAVATLAPVVPYQTCASY